MSWPEFKFDRNRYQVVCPYCGRALCYTHPPSGKGRHPASLINHLLGCKPGLTGRERHQVAEDIWAERKAVA